MNCFKKKYPKATYDSLEFAPYRSKLNEVLVKEQKYLCAYCCCRINIDKSHNEHIEPRHPQNKVSQKSLDYGNLVASCYGYKGERTCGAKKENQYDEAQFISPLDVSCEDIFRYYPNGEMEGNPYTIDLLNLNSYKLKKAREAVYNTIMEMDKETIQQIYLNEHEDKRQPFLNVIKWYIRQERNMQNSE